jgi:phospholipid transport system substrate-binding protein
MKRLLHFAATLVLAGAASMVNAVETAPPESAHEVVRQATDAVMSAVDEAQAHSDSEPDQFYDQLQEILDTVVDFRGFARSVMGPYASNERFRSLDAEGREQLRDQLDRFTEVMRTGLVRTYGKGLLAFAGSRIELPELSEAEAAGSRAAVRQLIYSDGSEPYVLVYHMGRGSDGIWKLRNMVIENVNLGQVYRSQFESSARKHGGDLNRVIGDWTAVDIEG